jgi:hypothetical protein
MSYQYVEAPHYVDLPLDQPSIFLGGGISGVEDWQAKACRALEGFGDITVVNPRRKAFNMDGGDAMTAEQIKWEHHYLDQVSQVLFWFSNETIQPIVLFELGARLREYKWRPNYGGIRGKQPMFIGCHPDYSRKMDVYHQARLEGYMEEFPSSLDGLLKDVLKFNQLYRLIH